MAADAAFVRDRYLFSADRKASEYRTVLEITPGHARLVTPSAAARMLRWILSIVLFGFYTTVVTASVLGLLILAAGPWLPGWMAFLLFAVVWLAGLFLFFGWWDRTTLPLLAETPYQASELILLGATSFGSFQDVRAKTLRGEELHLVVDARAPRFWEAVGLLEGKSAAST